MQTLRAALAVLGKGCQRPPRCPRLLQLPLASTHASHCYLRGAGPGTSPAKRYRVRWAVASSCPLPRGLRAVFQESPTQAANPCSELSQTNRYGHKHCVDPRGSLTDPLVKITGKWQPRVPNTIFGTIALLGGSATLFLPETLNQPTPETIEDMETWSVALAPPVLLPGEAGLGPSLS